MIVDLAKRKHQQHEADLAIGPLGLAVERFVKPLRDRVHLRSVRRFDRPVAQSLSHGPAPFARSFRQNFIWPYVGWEMTFERLRHDLEPLPAPVDLAFDLGLQIKPNRQARILLRFDQTAGIPLLVENNASQDLSHLLVGDADGDDLSFELEQDLIPHLLILGRLFAARLVGADREIFTRKIRKPIGFASLEDDRLHNPGQRFGVFNADDLFVFPAAQLARVDPPRLELGIEIMWPLSLWRTGQAIRFSRQLERRFGLLRVVGFDLN